MTRQPRKKPERGWFATWLALTRAPVHSLLAVAPLVLLHAFLTWLFEPEVTLAAASWIERPLARIGFGPFESAVAIAGLFVIVGLALSARQLAAREISVRPVAIPVIWGEGLAWGALLHLAWNGPRSGTRQVAEGQPNLGIGDELALAIGAGVYEELVFRVGVYWVALQLFRWLDRRGVGDEDGPTVRHVAGAVLLTSVIFAMAHHLGPEPFTWGAFAFRTVAAFYLTCLFALRGLGVAVTAHCAYDVFVAFW